jgi:glutamate transport system permease protein
MRPSHDRLIELPVQRWTDALAESFGNRRRSTFGPHSIGAELLRSGRTAVEFLGGRYSIPIYTAIAVVYIAVNGSLSFLARWLDRYTRRRYGRAVQPSGADEAA